MIKVTSFSDPDNQNLKTLIEKYFLANTFEEYDNFI